MEKISFCKMNGAGNDFILFDLNNNPGFVLNSNVITTLCNRRTGIGADGIITVKGLPDSTFDMNYYNADGSTGTLCGNGARCALKFAFDKGFIHKKAYFTSSGLNYSGEIIDESTVKFNLNNPFDIKLNLNLELDNKILLTHFANTGSPHLIVFNNDLVNFNRFFSGALTLQNLNVLEAGKTLRHHKFFATTGTNVNFIEINNSEINIRTFERGVEDETLACGTGSVAAVVICSLLNLVGSPVSLNTAGGDKLVVSFNRSNDFITDLTLTGPVKIAFHGTVNF